LVSKNDISSFGLPTQSQAANDYNDQDRFQQYSRSKRASLQDPRCQDRPNSEHTGSRLQNGQNPINTGNKLLNDNS